MSSTSPWEQIAIPDADFNVRHITAPGPVTLCWGKDSQGQCLFVVELEGDHTEQFRKNYMTVHGIKVDLRQLPSSSRQGLILTLEKHVDSDLFHGLCQTLIGNLNEIREPAVALTVAINHIKRWKAFMAGKRTRLLSAEEVRGLFAELSFLKTLKTEHLSEVEALHAWCGPERTHQDFVYSDTAVEIKSVSGRDRSIVRVSSEDQLESVSDNLFLHVIRLNETSENSGQKSLNDLVDDIAQELTDAEAIEQLWDKLAAYGYVEMREYDSPKFIAGGKRTYRVADDFPKLVRSELQDGVQNVRYDIQLEKLTPFQCEQEELWSS